MKIYLDNAATTPLMPEADRAMRAFVSDYFYNPSASYTFSKDVRKKIEEAREVIAGLIEAEPEEIFFTSGGSEGDNWAIKEGLYRGHVITDAIEHKAVLNTVKSAPYGRYSIIPVDRDGTVDINAIKKHMRRDTSMISIMYANNEIGTIEPIDCIANCAREYELLFHCDAVQAFGHIPLSMKKVNMDIMSTSAHKFNGPKGTGFIYIRKNTGIRPMIYGGGQEKNMRAGTENVPGIIGMAVAAKKSCERLKEKSQHMVVLSSYVIKRLITEIPDCRLNGPAPGEKRLPNNISISFKNIDGQSLLVLLDMKGIMASAGSACNSSEKKTSHVLKAIGVEKGYIDGTIRLTIDENFSYRTADYVINCIKESVNVLRNQKK